VRAQSIFFFLFFKFLIMNAAPFRHVMPDLKWESRFVCADISRLWEVVKPVVS